MVENVQALFDAAKRNDVVALDAALTHHDVNARDENGMTALHHAAQAQAFDAIERLRQEPDLDAAIQDNNGQFAADSLRDHAHRNHQALASLHPDQRLFEQAQEPYDLSDEEWGEIDDEPSDDVLQYLGAARRGDLPQLEDGMTRCDLNATDALGVSALHNAALHLQVEAVDRLLKEIPNGLDPNAEDIAGRTPAELVREAYPVNYPRAQVVYEKLIVHAGHEIAAGLQHDDAAADGFPEP